MGHPLAARRYQRLGACYGGRTRDENPFRYEPVMLQCRGQGRQYCLPLIERVVAPAQPLLWPHGYIPILPKLELSSPPCVADTRWVRPLQADAVSYYRIYMFDHNHRIVTGLDGDCRSDEAAFAWAANALGADARADIWHGTRLVGRISGV